MQKIVIHRPGTFNRLKIESFPNPVASENEVVVEVKAMGVNYADCVIRMGFYASAKEYVGWPITPGFDFSGVVSKVGNNIQDLSPGTPVFGISRFNSYATHVVVPRHQVFILPEKYNFEEAAAFPTIYLTAYYALHMVTKIFPGSTLLIHSAAGGVGSALLQLSRHAGWRTIGIVGSPAKVDAAKSMGADIVIDKSQENLWSAVDKHAPHGLDAVLDGNGYITLKEGARRLRNNGKLIAYGFHSMLPKFSGKANIFKLAFGYLRTPRFNPVSSKYRNISLITFNLSFMFDRTDLFAAAMQDLYNWFDQRVILIPQITTYSFSEAAHAHKDLQSGKTVGKLVLVH
jgi:NADPH:quinone reductase-like Zn-dependent oxidoreductase